MNHWQLFACLHLGWERWLSIAQSNGPSFYRQDFGRFRLNAHSPALFSQPDLAVSKIPSNLWSPWMPYRPTCLPCSKLKEISDRNRTSVQRFGFWRPSQEGPWAPWPWASTSTTWPSYSIASSGASCFSSYQSSLPASSQATPLLARAADTSQICTDFGMVRCRFLIHRSQRHRFGMLPWFLRNRLWLGSWLDSTSTSMWPL